MTTPTVSLGQIAALFLKLGIIGFGGPAAHIAMMHKEVVVHRKWMDEQAFLDLLGATHLIPGPNSTEMAIHIGQAKGGWKGLIVAGLCFIVPAIVITVLIAFAYSKYGHLPEIQPFIYGIKPAIIAIIITALIPLSKKAFKNKGLIAIAIAVLLAGLLFSFDEIFLMLGAGVISMIFNKLTSTPTLKSFIPITIIPGLNVVSLWDSTNIKLFWVFLKIGAILYGSGYVLFAFLDTELVKTGMISKKVLMDAIAVGQFTPGPVFSSVTFIGFQINGWSGALIATLGIFLPSFLFVALLNPLIKILSKSSLFSNFLDAINAASIALIVNVCCDLGLESIQDWKTIFIALISFGVSLFYKKINSAFIVLLGAILGFILNGI